MTNQTPPPPSASLAHARSRFALQMQLVDGIRDDFRAELVASPAAAWAAFLASLEDELPRSAPTSPSAPPAAAADACVLTCGCVVSESLARATLLRTDQDQDTAARACPSCGARDAAVLGPATALRNIHAKIQAMKQALRLSVLAQDHDPQPDAVNPHDPQPDAPAEAAADDARHTLPPAHALAALGMSPDDPTNVALSNFTVRTHCLPSRSLANRSVSSFPMTSKSAAPVAWALLTLFFFSFRSTRNKQLLRRFADATRALPNDKLSLLDIFRSAASSVRSFQQELPPAPGPHHAFPLAAPPSVASSSSSTTGNQQLLDNNTPASGASPSLTPEELATYKLMSDSIGGVRLPKVLLQQRESFYNKCFPTYRKQFQHTISASSGFLLQGRAKPYVATAITPNATRLVVVSETSWSVYKVAPDYNDSPVLWLSGSSAGVITNHFEEKMNKGKSRSSAAAAAAAAQDPIYQHIYPTEKEDLVGWKHQMAAVSNRYLAVTGTGGLLRVYDMERNGRTVYHYKSDFSIKYLEMSASGQCIACTTTGINKSRPSEATGTSVASGKSGTSGTSGTSSASGGDTLVPMIVLHWMPYGDFCPQLVYYLAAPARASELPAGLGDAKVRFVDAETITMEVPYRDVINTVAFSSDDAYLACSTRDTGHILFISITNHRHPRLVKRLTRSYDMDDPETEGTTAVLFHPGNKLISVTAAAPHSYPFVIASNIAPNLAAAHTYPPAAEPARSLASSSSSVSPAPSAASGLAQPPPAPPPPNELSKIKLLMRVEKVGSMIYRAAVSPHSFLLRQAAVAATTAAATPGSGPNTAPSSSGAVPSASAAAATAAAAGAASVAVAYLDKNGLVYLMHTLDRRHKRIVVLTEMAAAPSYMQAAALRFTPTGHALFALDRKGNFHIQDFAAGYPSQAGISKCRILG